MLEEQKNFSRSVLGAPSQHNQSSRKGKRAWRKNVNIEDVEKGLENIRAEERATGTALQKIQDVDLFQVDLKGDDNIRKSLPRSSSAQLTSAKILAQRSAVPAVVSRISTSKKRKPILGQEDKERLLRIAKRPRKGPLNGIMDPSEYASGSSVFGLSEAVRQSGTYDPWAPEPPQENLKDGLETVQAMVVKAPTWTKPRDMIKVPAVMEPHQGTSYNPPADAHHELLLKAASIEQKRVTKAEKLAEVKTRMESCRVKDDLGEIHLAAGMSVQEIGDQDEKEDVSANFPSDTRAAPARKTKAQRNKEARLSAEKRVLAERIHKRRLLGSLNEAKNIRRAAMKFVMEREQFREQKRLATTEKLERQGLAGMKIGKHKVPEPDLEVQLGENLSENLRGLKTEGNLFRDRFQSLQQRALIEPRVRLLPKRRRHRLVEYEKHAWKKFE